MLETDIPQMKWQIWLVELSKKSPEQLGQPLISIETWMWDPNQVNLEWILMSLVQSLDLL